MSHVCSLMKTYKCHTVKLCTTENGVRDEGDSDGPDSEEYTTSVGFRQGIGHLLMSVT